MRGTRLRAVGRAATRLAWRRATMRVALRRAGTRTVWVPLRGSNAMRSMVGRRASTAVSLGGQPPLQSCDIDCKKAASDGWRALWTHPAGPGDHEGPTQWRTAYARPTRAAHDPCPDADDHPCDRPRERRGGQGRQPLSPDRSARRHPAGRSWPRSVRARHAHPVDLCAAAERRAADPPARSVPRQWRRYHPADEPGAPAQPGGQADSGIEPGTP